MSRLPFYDTVGLKQGFQPGCCAVRGGPGGSCKGCQTVLGGQTWFTGLNPEFLQMGIDSVKNIVG